METELFYHTKNRLKERYGLDIDEEVYQNLCRDLMRLKVEIYSSRPAGGGRSELCIEFQGQRVRIIWDKRTRNIVTVLPREGNDQSASSRG
jgi:hypothetical protein